MEESRRTLLKGLDVARDEVARSDRRVVGQIVLLKVKKMFDKTVVRPVMCGSGGRVCTTKRKMKILEIMLLRLTCGVARLD